MPKSAARLEPVENYVAVPSSGRGPGVLVLHAWWGRTDFIRTVCDRLAGLGFVALAPDLYHGRTASTVDEAKRLSSTLDDSLAQKELLAALDDLLHRPKVGIHPVGLLGFSLGAAYALWLAGERGPDISGVVVYYGTGGGNHGKSKAAFLGHFAENDPYEPADSLKTFERELRAAGWEVTIHVYPGTGHWFFEEDRKDAYNAKAAKLSWKRTAEFLRTRLR